MTHLGRPKGKVNDKFSLSHIVDEVSKVLGKEVKFASLIVSVKLQKSQLLNFNQEKFLLLEKTLDFIMKKKKGDEEFAGKLAKLGDVYVNDAFERLTELMFYCCNC